MPIAREITQEHINLFQKSFMYDRETGVLYWEQSNGRRVKKGEVVGSFDKQGYLIVGLNQQRWKVHRVIFSMFNGPQPRGQEIDHVKSKEITNNRLSNLRYGDKSKQSCNTKKRSDNTSGFKGVSWNKRDNCYEAYVMKNYVQHKECFQSKFAAILFVQMMREELHGEYHCHE